LKSKYIDENLNLKRDLRISSEVVSIVSKPRGPIIKSVREITPGMLIAIGDYVVKWLFENGRSPNIAVVDGIVMRRKFHVDIPRDYKRLSAKNPPGHITVEAWNIMKRAVEIAEKGDKVVVEIRGEEDLLGFPAAILAPPNSSMVYGQPGEGAVLVRINEKVKREAIHLLDRFIPLEE